MGAVCGIVRKAAKLDYRSPTTEQQTHKILFLASNEWPNWGGSERLWTLTADKLASRGNEIRVSAPDFGKAIPQVEELKSIGCRVFYRSQPPFLSRLARKFLPPPEPSLSHLQVVAKDVDLIVISQGANADGLAWMEAARKVGRKYAVIVQAAAEHWWPEDRYAKRLAESYEKASGSYFVSQATLDLTRRQIATPMRRAKVVRNPFNVPYESKLPWPAEVSNKLALACVARLEPGHKGQDLLLEVLNLPHWRKRDIQVSLVGQGQNELSLMRLRQELELFNVEFWGHKTDLLAVWAHHHALVLPSRHEGMPLTVVEAMLCGRPCIVTDVGGSRELVQDGRNGFLAKAPTIELLDDAMNRAWENRGRLPEMGNNAAADVRNWVSPDPAEDFVSELLSLIGSPVMVSA